MRQSSVLVSVEIRPARRSVTSPSETVQKLTRAATSPGPTSRPIPMAEYAPADHEFLGVVAEEAQVPRTAARRHPGRYRVDEPAG